VPTSLDIQVLGVGMWNIRRLWPVLPTVLLFLLDDDPPDTHQYGDNKSRHSSHNNADELNHDEVFAVLWYMKSRY
jgi:hypothetical protein